MMDTNALQHFIAGISFNHLQPEDPLPDAFGGLNGAMYMEPRIRTLIETWNTVMPVSPTMLTELQMLGALPRMSTLALGAMIQLIVSKMPADQMYVNVGFWHGFSLFAGMLENPTKQCIGIDNFSQFGDPQLRFLEEFSKRRSPLHQFFQQDYRDYFATHSGPIGLYFYDGDHAYEHQKEGLELAHPFMAKSGLILVDDTNWDDPRKATEDFLSEHAGDYECIVDLKTAHNSHPTFWNGIMILRKTEV